MRLTKSLLKHIVKEELLNSQGLTTNFQQDDMVKDINPDCPHFNSQGIVIKVTPNDVTYRVTNNGNTYEDGDELTKSTDQLVKLNSDELDETFSTGTRKERVSQTKKTAEVLGNTMVGEVDEPTWDLTKSKDRGDNLGESKIPLTEIRKKFVIHNLKDSRLKDLVLKALKKLRGSKVLKDDGVNIALEIESKYMDVLGDFIKKYDRSKDVKIIDQFKAVVYDMKKGINKLREGMLLEKKELDSKSVKKVAQMTDRNNHTEARIFLSAKMGWKKGIKFYKAMMDINDVFNGYPGGASQLNNMMEKELYREMLRTWSNYDDIYNSL